MDFKRTRRRRVLQLLLLATLAGVCWTLAKQPQTPQATSQLRPHARRLETSHRSHFTHLQRDSGGDTSRESSLDSQSEPSLSRSDKARRITTAPEDYDADIFLHTTRPPGEPIGCVGWRTTKSCTPFGALLHDEFKGCEDHITSGSGYCQCSDRWTAKRVYCAVHDFNCKDACEALNTNFLDALRLPPRVTCPAPGSGGGSGHSLHSLPPFLNRLQPALHGFTSEWASRRDLITNRTDEFQGKMGEVFGLFDQQRLQLGYARNWEMDGSQNGQRMADGEIEKARAQWQAFMRVAPPYPEGLFRGRGIVIVSGAEKYLVPSWVTLYMIRRTGCTLPIELWFPDNEFPPPELEATFQSVFGAVCRRLHMGGGYQLKVYALLFSQFEEALYLDADNMPILDPATLFESPYYNATGALLWPDYWIGTAVPEAKEILGLQELEVRTIESGQLLFHKRRCWRPLLLAAFLNNHAQLYYDLFTRLHGKGDKETYLYAFRALNQSVAVVSHNSGSLGSPTNVCEMPHCWEEFEGVTQAQFDPAGRLMFLHDNHRKLTLEIPGSFVHYRRRWNVFQPGAVPARDMMAELPYDAEAAVYRALYMLRCAEFLPQYNELLTSRGRSALPMELEGCHPRSEGGQNFFRQPRDVYPLLDENLRKLVVPQTASKALVVT